MKKIVPLLLILITMALYSGAQNEDRVWGLNIDYGTLEYSGELGNQLFDFSKWQSGWGLELSRYLSSSFNFGIRGGYNFLNASKSTSIGLLSMKGDMYSLTGSLECKFANGSLISKNAFLKPYIKIGGGKMFGTTWGTRLVNSDSIADYHYSLDNDWQYFASVGTKIRISKSINAFLEISNLWVTSVGLDGAKGDVSKDQFIRLNAGISFALGEFKDADNDGVSDKNDQCPRTPDKVVVDIFGCPLDTDEDGIPDFKDNCPAEIGSIKTSGCPDRDNDEVADRVDNCPDDPGPISNSGCPVVEKGKGTDNTPQSNIPAGVNIIILGQGSNVQIPGILFDSDLDGVSDNIDRCPGVKGTLANFGCPDSMATPSENKQNTVTNIVVGGSPIENLSPKWRKDLKTSPVHFVSGKIDLTEYSKGNVDKVIEMMKSNDKLNVWLFGHSDPLGDEDSNEKLSESRLTTIVSYLQSKGIPKERIFTMAFGESFPASLGKTEDDLMRNRRVEFYLFEFQ